MAPDTIKDMLTYAVDKCVQDKDQGGFVTHLLERATNWIVKPENEFPGEPGHLYLRKSFSFTFDPRMILAPWSNATRLAAAAFE